MAVVGQVGHTVARVVNFVVVVPVADQDQRTERVAVVAGVERNDLRAAGHFFGKFDRRFDGVRPGWGGKLPFALQIMRFQDAVFDRSEEPDFRFGRHVQRVRAATVREVLNQRLLDQRTITTVVERPDAGEEIDAPPALGIDRLGTASVGKDDRE